jgi:hypothetical protein
LIHYKPTDIHHDFIIKKRRRNIWYLIQYYLQLY